MDVQERLDRIEKLQSRAETEHHKLADRLDKFQSQVESDQGQFDERVEKVSSDIAQIDESIASSIDRRFASYQSKAKYFLGGFGAFVGISALVGLLFKEQIRYPLIEMVYPTERTVRQIGEVLRGDSTHREAFRNGVWPEAQFPAVTLDKFPQINQELPRRVWTAIQSGNEDEFRKLVSKQEFFETLRKQYEADLARMFNTVGGVGASKELQDRVKEAGKVPLPAVLKVVAQAQDNEPTTCGLTLEHRKAQAVVVIPKTERPWDYWWINCAPYFPRLALAIKVSGTAVEVAEIAVVGVQQGASDQNLEVRLSRAAAEKLRIAGADNYMGRVDGTINVRLAASR